MDRVIVAGVDRSAGSRAAAGWAAREALRRGLPLRVVHVTPPDGHDRAERLPYRSETMADRVAAELADRNPALTVRGLRLSGAAEPHLCSLSGHAEMVVIGVRGEGGAAGVSVGATTAAVAGHCSCPLVLVPGAYPGPEASGGVGTVVVGVDARDPADGALGFAFEMARLHRVRLHAVHASHRPQKDRGTGEEQEQEVRLLSDALRPWRGKYPDVDVREDVVPLGPTQALAQASEGAELVVIGRRRGESARVLVEHVRCPVAVVPS